jgi:serine/threonine protein kinase/tetratricopeptide (TPR) repeat protein
MIGQTIAHYRILEKLGEGGMGVVYKAEDTKLGRMVALKFPPIKSGASSEERVRLTHEARAAASLDHPNICTIHEIGEVDGQPYIAMALVDGQSLRDRLHGGPLNLVDALSIANQIAEGLAAAHERGIIHRDIKPENIMVNARGQVRIMDFGLAKSLQWQTKITQEGSTPGTAAYMAPEQARGETVDARADLWSLGVVIYESLTGALPFEGSHPAAVMYSVLHEPHRSMRDRKPMVTPEVESLVDRLLRKDPVQRPSGAQAVANELAQIRQAMTSSTRSQPGVKEAALPSLAVLPFSNMSSDAENEFFADGLTEDLITAFSKMENLRVVARTSAFQFKGKTSDIRRVGEQLSVGTVLEGSVRRAGNRLRVTAQLINVADGFHIWSERYDREMADVFEIQDDIARAIVDALKVKLTGDRGSALVECCTTNMEAYQLILQARYFWNKRTADGLAKAESLYLRAIALDPNYADAHAGLAMNYFTMTDYTSRPPTELNQKASAAAEVALRLDPDAVEAHCAMGFLHMDRFEWDKAEQSLRRAIELNPGFATAHHWYALLLLAVRREDEAAAELEKAKALDPLSPVIRANLASAYRTRGDINRAKTELDTAFEMDPNSPPVLTHLSFYHEEIGDFNAAAEDIRRAAVVNPQGRIYINMARFLYLAGRFEDVAKALDHWTGQIEQVTITESFGEAFQKEGVDGIRRKFVELCGVPWDHNHAWTDAIAALWVALGDWDRAFQWLDRGCEVSPHGIVFMSYARQIWAPLHNDPRFQAIMRKARIPNA